MSNKTIEEMQAELKEVGYKFKTHYLGMPYYSFTTPDLYALTSEKYEYNAAVELAYRHLQDRRKLAALEDFVKQIANNEWITSIYCRYQAQELLAKFEESGDE